MEQITGITAQGHEYAPALWQRRSGGEGAWQAPEPPATTALEPPIAAPLGLERRLVRRAQALWQQLRCGDALPPPDAAHRVLGPLFAGQSLLVEIPLERGRLPRILFAGEGLSKLAAIETGIAEADPDSEAPVAQRLVALAAQAVAASAPRLLDTDNDTLADGRRPDVQMRAIALPMAAGGDDPGVQTAAVVVSWRKLLSTDETAALHRELASAIEWMREPAVAR